MTSSDWSPKRDVLERILLSVGVALLFFLGYFHVGFSTEPERAHDFATEWDHRIPFLASSVWIYLWSFSASAIPLFIIRGQRLFRRVCLAFAIDIVLSLICFVAEPVTALHLRADNSQLQVADASHWVLAEVYSLDPPYNLFPSLHVSITALAALAVWKANRRFGWILFVGLALVAVSVCTTKQHFLFDVLGGLAMAALVGGAILVPYQAEGPKVTYSWRGPVSYAGSMALMYLGLYTAYFWAT